MKLLPNRKTQKGQALLIILLVLSVVLTVSLSAVSRSITDISISTTEEESLRAFSAAEAGIEEALISSDTTPKDNISLNDRASYSVNFPDAKPTFNQMIYKRVFRSGETATLWFVSQDNNGLFVCGSNDKPCVQASDVEFCWGSSEYPTDKPALEISLYYDTTQSSQDTQDYSDVEISRKVFDPVPNRVDPIPIENVLGSCGFSGILAYSTGKLSLSGDFGIPAGCLEENGCLLFARTRFFYNDNAQPIGLSFTPRAGGPETSRLPAQGIVIESTGKSGESSRKVNVFQSFAEPPEIFDSAVFSLNNLIKSN